jgi:large subunit ribosomal protein L22
MGKERNPRRVDENEAFAVNRFIRSSPIKLNLVAEMIRGKKVEKALAELTFSRKRIAGQVKRTLESAIANAENNHQLDVDSLVVAQAHVGKRMVLKRFHARGRGRAGRIEKFFSQLTIVVRETDGEEKKRKGKGRKVGKPAAEAAAT